MAFIPQFNQGQAIPTAKPGAPVLNRERQRGIDAGAVMGSLGQAAQSFANFGKASEQPLIPLNAYDGKWQGASQIGRAIEQVGDVSYRIAMQRAEAKNYADVNEAVTEMEAEWEGLQSYFKLNQHNPESFQPEFQRRFTQLGKKLDSRKDLSPAAQEQIRQRFQSYSTINAQRTESAINQATFNRAKESGLARFYKAVDNNDLEGAGEIVGEMSERGYVFADAAARLMLSAKEQIEAVQIEDGRDEIKHWLTERQPDQALAVLDRMPIRDAEKKAIRSDIERNHALNILSDEAQDAIAEDPVAAARELENDNGKYSALSKARRSKLLDDAVMERNQNRNAIMESVREEIDLGNIQSLEDLQKRADAGMLTEHDALLVEEYLNKGEINDIANFSKVKAQILTYDPNGDPRGVQKQDIINTIDMLFDGERKEELITTFEEWQDQLASGVPQNVKDLTRTSGQLFSDLDKAVEENELGEFRVPSSRYDGLEYEEETGAVRYRKAFRWFGPHEWEYLDVSQSDKEAIANGKIPAFLTLENERKKAYAEKNAITERMESKLKNGEYETAEDMRKDKNAMLYGKMRNSLESKLPSGEGGIDSGLFPNPERSLEQLLDDAGY